MDAARHAEIRARIVALKAELRQLWDELAAEPLVYERVLALVKDGCNTSCDIADEMPAMTVRNASATLRQLALRGLVRRTGRFIRRDDGNKLVVWEAV